MARNVPQEKTYLQQGISCMTGILFPKDSHFLKENLN